MRADKSLSHQQSVHASDGSARAKSNTEDEQGIFAGDHGERSVFERLKSRGQAKIGRFDAEAEPSDGTRASQTPQVQRAISIASLIPKHLSEFHLS